MSLIEYRDVTMSFGRSVILTGINFTIQKGEFVAIVGPSGCGKTTLVNLAAGLLQPSGGTVLHHGKPITGPGPERALVFQNYSLLPWMSVSGNIALAVDRVFASESRDQRKERVNTVIELVGLSPARDRRPAQLSGGMKQRVALARTLAIAPELLLLDEPLGALDALTRANLQDEISMLARSGGKSVLLITNDVDEALLMADRVIPILPGNGGTTLGESVDVGIPCPRDRQAINHEPQFRELRKRILVNLTGSVRGTQTALTRKLVLPKVLPEDITHLSPFERWFPGQGAKRPSEIHVEKTTQVE